MGKRSVEQQESRRLGHSNSFHPGGNSTKNRLCGSIGKEIDWVEAEDNYVRVHRKNESYLIRQKMSALEQELDPRQFVRIHRGAIVNVDKIQELHQVFHRDYRVVLQDGTKLPLSRSYRQKLRDALKNQF